ncbi:probable cytochrome P450 CYP44 [Pomacea canaliculata]|nr:probable cytochrome P450 CYP44 [Pomacea canaliculata]
MVCERIAGRTTLFVFDPENVREVYQEEGKWPLIDPLVETTQMYRRQKKHSPGMGNTNGEEWYRIRRGAHYLMLVPREVAAYLPLVDDVATAFTNHLDNIRDDQGRVSRLDVEVSKWNLETAAMIAFDDRKHFFNTAAHLWQTLDRGQ